MWSASQTVKMLFIALAVMLTAGCSSDNGSANQPVNQVVVSQEARTGAAKPIEITVYKSPTCGCCKGWIEHLRTEGFTVITHDRQNMNPIKRSMGIPDHLESCHTAMVEGYAIEGHVPAADIKQLLKDRPNIAGLTAPGMPMKSPGMQASHLPPKDYDVLAFTENGQTSVFTQY